MIASESRPLEDFGQTRGLVLSAMRELVGENSSCSWQALRDHVSRKIPAAVMYAVQVGISNIMIGL